MPFSYISVRSQFWYQFGGFVIVAVGALIAILRRRLLTKPAAEGPPVKLFRPCFNQRSGTPQAELRPNPVRHYASCHCLDTQYELEEDEDKDEVEEERVQEDGVSRREWQELQFHTEVQDTSSDAWESLEAYIAKVRDEGSDELNPMAAIGCEKWEQIVTLPKSIATLKSIKVLSLYGSHLVRIPPEIGDMTNLEAHPPLNAAENARYQMRSRCSDSEC